MLDFKNIFVFFTESLNSINIEHDNYMNSVTVKLDDKFLVLNFLNNMLKDDTLDEFAIEHINDMIDSINTPNKIDLGINFKIGEIDYSLIIVDSNIILTSKNPIDYNDIENVFRSNQ